MISCNSLKLRYARFGKVTVGIALGKISSLTCQEASEGAIVIVMF